MMSAASGVATTGLFLVPFLPAAVLPGLHVDVANLGRSPAKASVKVNLLDRNTKKRYKSFILDIAQGSNTSIDIPLAEVEGHAAEVVFAGDKPGLEPSVTLLKTYTFDNTADMALFIPPSSFARLGGGGYAGTLTTGPFIVPNVAQVPELMVHLDNSSGMRGRVRVVIREAQEGGWANVLDRTVTVDASGGATIAFDVTPYKGKTLAVLVAGHKGVLPSAELVITFQADAANQSLFWLSPAQFADAGSRVLRPPGAGAEGDDTWSFITRTVADVTGDGRDDVVSLYGRLAGDSSAYYEAIRVEVKSGRTGKLASWEPAGGSNSGYKPVLWTAPFSNRRVYDILVVTDTGGSGGYAAYSAYSALHLKPKLILDPDVLSGVVVEGVFEDGYKARVTVVNTGQTYVLDLSDRKQLYDDEGVYSDGKLLKPVDISYTPFISLKPAPLSNSGGRFGLSGVQAVKGIYNADNLARISSVWRLDKKGWVLVESRVDPVRHD